MLVKSVLMTIPRARTRSRLLFGALAVCVLLTCSPAFAGGSLAAAPRSLSFGSVQVGSSANQYETITNKSPGSLTISKLNISGSGFTVTGLALPMTLTSGQSVTVTIAFAPQTSGSITGNFSVSSKSSHSSVSVGLSGTGTAAGQLNVSPAALNFGNVNVGKTAALTSSLSASGGSVTISSVTSSSSEFVLSGFSLPLTIAAGQTVPFTVSFDPQTSGAVSAKLSFITTPMSAATESLTGSGVATTNQHSVSLTWTDGSSGISGYNVYRSSVSGGPYTKINSALDPTTAYTDSAVSAGQTYFYVTTAVNTSGVESKYSNQVLALVPSP